MDVVDTRRPSRQDTFDLREQLQQDDSPIHAHADAASSTFVGTDDEHSVLDDDSDGEEHDEYMDVDDDGSSSLSIPNESIDFDLVYSLHSFAATVEGQANVVKGDSLFLMDDSNSYWWLVRVLKTQEVGYIPAENIETPFERLARLNKHRNIDLASATQAELNEGLHASQDRLRTNLNSRAGSNHSPSPIPRGGSRAPPPRGVQFIASMYVHRYPPAIWREDEVEDPNDEWDDEAYEYQDQELAEELMQQKKQESGPDFEPDDGVPWDESAAREMQARQMQSQTKSPSPQTSRDQADQQQRQQQQQQLQLQQQAQQQQVEQELQVQQQRELVAQQQQIQLQRQQQLKQQQAITDQQIPQVQVQPLRPSNSRERLNGSQETASSQSNSRSIDPAQATETRKLTATPTIARDDDQSGPYLPSAILEKQREEERVKRHREEEMAEESKKKAKGKEKMPPPVSSANYGKSSAGGKLRKEQKESEDEGKDKKKKSMFSNIFGKKKDKKDKNLSVGSVESSELTIRGSEDSSRSGSRPSLVEGVMSPTTATALQQQQQQALRASVESRRPVQPETPERPPLNQVSQHASQLRQRDQQQQALYQQYLNRSPSSPPEAQPSYGLQSASAMGLSSYQKDIGSPSANLGPPASRPRPGSLILTPAAPDGPGVPELSVIRVFAGKNLQTEATFKTVLLNSSTTSGDLVRQALQRFRLSAGEDEGDYYLTVKQVEGGASAVLLPTEKPLVVFETLVVEAMELPKVKRSSVGSISSVASNLSMHPAIKKLPMNDFTDDSAVKFYLNRRSDDEVDDSVNGHGAEGDETLIAADMSFSESETQSPMRTTYLTVSTNHNVTPERFTSPSFRFALQLVVYPEDLPDDMAFHPYTEAIVFKDSLKDTDMTSSPKVSPTMRRKVFVFAKNVTVAEVIEIGLERFGIPEGVVDGGDEVEDKMTKRRSSARVRYILAIDTRNGDRERELLPSHRIIDAFPRPPTLRAVERSSLTNKRRSVDSAQILGSVDDVNADDPVFILRRATAYRNSTSRHRMSAPLDEIALQQLHRESASSTGSDAAPPDGHEQQRQPSRQEIIARQREATRAKQSAILTAQSNSLRGMDVLLPGNAMLRSYDANDKMRYSYVEPDGETYDISDIVEEELRENHQASRDDLLEGVLGRRDVGGEKLDRVLSKIRSGKNKEKDLSSLSSVDSRRSASLSDYSADDASAEGKREQTRSVTPGQQQQPVPRAESARHVRTPSAGLLEDRHSRPGTTTPTGKAINTPSSSRRQPSIASVMSDLSGYATAQTNPVTSPVTETSRSTANTPKPQPKRVYLPDDDFGVSRMLAIIECRGSQPKTPLPPLAPADALLFGRPVDLQSLHPQVREVYADTFKQLEEMDKVLDDYLEKLVGGF